MPIISRPEVEIIKEEVRIKSGSYQLHGELAYPAEGQATGVIVIAGPHPLLGGNMSNNVVRTLADGLATRGLLTLRFDYRGVGRSQGPQIDVSEHMAEFWKTSHAPGELEFWKDLQAAKDFARQVTPELPLALVGYSFGCALLPFIQPHHEIDALVLIAPTVAKHDYDSFLELHNRTLVVASEDDFAVDAERLKTWFSSLSMPRQIVRQKCDNHFFRGHEEWLVESVVDFLETQRGK
jgi:alpha/beta superfamily hydrolase